MNILVSWIGQTDLNAAHGEERAGQGPVGQAVTQRSFDLIVLLSNYSKANSADYIAWIEGHTKAAVELNLIKLSSPTNFGEIYEVNNKRVHAVRNDGEQDRIHLIFECYNVDDYGKVEI